jgi:holo-[acyl-carrier protein] synthase
MADDVIEDPAPPRPLQRREFSPSALAGEPSWLAMLGLSLADAQDGLLQCGVDIIEIPRIAAAIDRWGQPILDRVWTPAEQRYCRGRLPELAARFAAKEAVSKTLGTGIRGIRWREIEILSDRRGKPLIFLHGGAQERATVIRLTRWAISLTHGRDLAIAFVVASGDPGAAD